MSMLRRRRHTTRRLATTALAGGLLAACSGCGALPVEPTPAQPASSLPAPAASSSAASPGGVPEVEALRVERVIEVSMRVSAGSPGITRSRAVTWRRGAIIREESEAVGIVPAKTTLYDAAEGTVWLVDDEARMVAPIDRLGAGERATVATDLGLALTPDQQLVLDDPLFVEEARATPPEGVIKGPGRSFTRRGSSTRLRLWVVPGLALQARDYADGLRRRIPRPHGPADERLFAAFEALPGYPAQAETTSANGKLVVTNSVVAIERVRVPQDRFILPAGYARVESGTRLLVEKAQRTWAREEREGRARLGLDKPFEPTAARPIPPPLPGGSCTPEADGRSPAPGCREAWDGRETNFAGYCTMPFDFDKACSRARLKGVCEREDRTSLEYYYRPGGNAVCQGRWYDVP